MALIPLLWMLSTSLKDNGSVFEYPPKWVPEHLRFSNYTSLWDDLPMNRWLVNTFAVSTIVVLVQLRFCSMAAYAFARLRFRWSDQVFYVFLASMMVPYQVTLIPAFVLISKLGWVDTYQGLIVPQLSTAFGIFLLRQFFLSLPRELEEAARMDGASYWRIYRSILLPLSVPALLAFGVFSFIGMWGDFLWPLIVINSPEKMTLTVGPELPQLLLHDRLDPAHGRRRHLPAAPDGDLRARAASLHLGDQHDRTERLNSPSAPLRPSCASTSRSAPCSSRTPTTAPPARSRPTRCACARSTRASPPERSSPPTAARTRT